MVKLAECNYASKEKKIVLLFQITTTLEKNILIVLLQSKTKVTAPQTMLSKVLVWLLIDSAFNPDPEKDHNLMLRLTPHVITNKETKNVVKEEY